MFGVRGQVFRDYANGIESEPMTRSEVKDNSYGNSVTTPQDLKLSLIHIYRKHARIVGDVMRWYANELGYGAEADFWQTAVSYTHLDEYKRQGCSCRHIWSSGQPHGRRSGPGPGW